VRRARRTLSLATHPDKIGEAPGGATAFNLVTEVSGGLGASRGLAGGCMGGGALDGRLAVCGHLPICEFVCNVLILFMSCPRCPAPPCPCLLQAAEILGDEASRRQYDAEMQQASLRNFA
jgi:hypothetical protein